PADHTAPPDGAGTPRPCDNDRAARSWSRRTVVHRDHQHLLVRHALLLLEQEVVVLRVIVRTLVIVTREAADRVVRLPEADQAEMSDVALDRAQHRVAEVAGRGAVVGEACALEKAEILVGAMCWNASVPRPRNHADTASARADSTRSRRDASSRPARRSGSRPGS